MLNAKLVYPVPCETKEVWEQFRPFVLRFRDTLKEHNTGYPYVLWAVFNGDAEAELRDIFDGIPTTFLRYEEPGFDIGACQYAAHRMELTDFAVNFTSRCYFYRENWLLRYVTARETNGPGLYGASASMEGGRMHICTRAYALDAVDFSDYPTVINSRDQGVFFECGEGCLFEWITKRSLRSYVVTFQDVYPPDRWLGVPGGFRDGDQKSMLVWDKHTDVFRDADEETRTRLRNLMLGKELEKA